MTEEEFDKELTDATAEALKFIESSQGLFENKDAPAFIAGYLAKATKGVAI